MNTLKQFFQRIKIKQLLVALFAGVLLLTSTACSSGGIEAGTPSSPSGSPNDTDRPQPGQAMYPTSDVQQGQDTTEADQKAERLIKEAKKRNQKGQTADVDEVVDKLTPDKSVSEQAEDLSKSAQKAAKNAAENTKEGLKNIKENTENMVDNNSVSEQAEDLRKSAQKAAKNAAENTREGLKNIKENTENMVDQAADAIN